MRPYLLPHLTIRRLPGRIGTMEKLISLWFPVEIFDSTGDQWVFLFADNSKENIGFKRDGKFHFRSGQFCAFLPPFSIVHWKLKRGKYTVYSLFSDNVLPESAPKEPVLFPFNDLKLFNVDNLFDVMKRERANSIQIGALNQPSATARKTKSFIDSHYREGVTLAEIAQKLGFSPSVLSRAFRAAYGIKPVDYEKQIRLYGALKNLVLNNSSIQTAATEVGFKHVGLFNRQFKSEFFTTPSLLKSSITGAVPA